MVTRNEIIALIARLWLDFETLESRNSDRLDFKEVCVLSVKHALEEAFDAGWRSGYADAKSEDVQ